MRGHSTRFCRRERRRGFNPGPLIVIWDNGPARGGEAVRDYLATPALALCLVCLPADSPACNPAEAIEAWARAEVTANTCLGTTAQVQERRGAFFAWLPASPHRSASSPFPHHATLSSSLIT
ncbi:MAG: hypothetical protein ACTHNK_13940 [Thermomicrobiales bacterium]